MNIVTIVVEDDGRVSYVSGVPKEATVVHPDGVEIRVNNVVIDVTQMPAGHGLLLLAANPQLYPN